MPRSFDDRGFHNSVVVDPSSAPRPTGRPRKYDWDSMPVGHSFEVQGAKDRKNAMSSAYAAGVKLSTKLYVNEAGQVRYLVVVRSKGGPITKTVRIDQSAEFNMQPWRKDDE